MADKKLFKPLLITVTIALVIFVVVVGIKNKEIGDMGYEIREQEQEDSGFRGYKGIPGYRVKESEKIEITDDLIEKLINNTLSTEYEDKTIRAYVVDLDSDGQDELIISAFEKAWPSDFKRNAVLMVVTPKKTLGRFDKVGGLKFVSNFSREIGGGGIGEDNRALDIDNDGVKEIVLDLGSNALGYNEFYGIFKIDFAANQIEWLQMESEYGTVRNTELSQGNANAGPTAFEIKDLDGDRILEIIETLYPLVHEPTGETIENVYKWNGQMFIFERNF